jgi:hypothetical protein
MVFNATFNNISAISWRSVLLVEETRVPGENHIVAVLLVEENYIHRLIDWCLTPTLAIFQLYRGVSKFLSLT